MPKKPEARCADAFEWMREQKLPTSELTGQDLRALKSVAHAWEVYSVGDEMTKRAALHAVAALLTTIQPKCRPLARELIAWAMDWNDRERIWPLVERARDAFVLAGVRRAS